MAEHLIDDDAPELDEAFFKRAKPAREVMSEAAQATFKPRGRPKAQAAKVAVKLRLDPDVLSAFKASGPGWQTRINATLRDAAGRFNTPAEPKK